MESVEDDSRTLCGLPLRSVMRTYRAEMRRAHERVAAAGRAKVTTKWGEVEYVDEGAGTPLLMSHGILGGHDNIRDLVDLWAGPQYRAIGPSRFGYFGSGIPAGATVVDQADAYVALLDHIEVERVVVLGVSAGGPSAIQLALRHPDRLYGLILASSYLPGMARPLPSVLQPVMRTAIGWQYGWWLLSRYRPKLLARIMGVPKGWDASHDPDFLAIREALFPIAPKKLGAAFDALVSEPASNSFPLEEIAVSTMLVHAADDRLAPYKYVPVAVARIPHARLATIEAGGHLFLEHAAEVRAAVGSFVAECLR